MVENKLLANLPEKTAGVLLALARAGKQKQMLANFILVGGTALAMHLGHRQSEDLDFFCDGTRLEKAKLFSFLKNNSIEYAILAEPSAEQVDLRIGDVKVSFFASGFDCLKRVNNIHFHNIEIASLELIAALKVYTLSLRSVLRDYYDLYVLNREVFPLERMFTISRDLLHMGTFKLFAQQLLYTRDIEESEMRQHLLPKYPVSREAIRSHFQAEIKKYYESLQGDKKEK
jgi:predicted nucleotidyltransferase component of viral defense system